MSAAELADRLEAAEVKRTAITPLSDETRLSEAEACAVQDELAAWRVRAGHRIVGAKLAFTSKAKQQMLGVDEPSYGWLTEMQVPAEGLDLGRLIHPRAEPELAVRLRRNLRGPVGGAAGRGGDRHGLRRARRRPLALPRLPLPTTSPTGPPAAPGSAGPSCRPAGSPWRSATSPSPPEASSSPRRPAPWHSATRCSRSPGWPRTSRTIRARAGRRRRAHGRAHGVLPAAQGSRSPRRPRARAGDPALPRLVVRAGRTPARPGDATAPGAHHRGMDPITFALPHRAGAAPRLTVGIPQQQASQNAPAELQELLFARASALPGVHFEPSAISVPGARAFVLDEAHARGPRGAFIVGRDFAHLHPSYDGSFHVTVPPPVVAEVQAKGWGLHHPLAGGRLSPTMVMIYGPRDAAEAESVCSILAAGHAYATGAVTDGLETHRLLTAPSPPPSPRARSSPSMGAAAPSTTPPRCSTASIPSGACSASRPVARSTTPPAARTGTSCRASASPTPRA